MHKTFTSTPKINNLALSWNLKCSCSLDINTPVESNLVKMCKSSGYANVICVCKCKSNDQDDTSAAWLLLLETCFKVLLTVTTGIFTVWSLLKSPRYYPNMLSTFEYLVMFMLVYVIIINGNAQSKWKKKKKTTPPTFCLQKF